MFLELWLEELTLVAAQHVYTWNLCGKMIIGRLQLITGQKALASFLK